MPVEVATTIKQLDPTWPLPGDFRSEAQAHIRQLKKILKDTLKGSGGSGYSIPIDATEVELNHAVGLTSNIQTQIDNSKNNMNLIGGIIQYSGLVSNIPSNYQQCDGTNGTPNLTGNFVRGTVTQAQILQTGGDADQEPIAHTHTVNHNHTASVDSAGSHLHTYPGSSGANTATQKVSVFGSLQGTGITSTSSGNHSHSSTINSASVTTGVNGVSGTDKNLPLFYTLMFIRRMS